MKWQYVLNKIKPIKRENYLQMSSSLKHFPHSFFKCLSHDPLLSVLKIRKQYFSSILYNFFLSLYPIVSCSEPPNGNGLWELRAFFLLKICFSISGSSISLAAQYNTLSLSLAENYSLGGEVAADGKAGSLGWMLISCQMLSAPYTNIKG